MTTKLNNYTIHPVADTQPLSTPQELDRLVEDIRLNGQLSPALVLGNQIIDGRHRLMACNRLNIELKVEHLDESTTEEELYATAYSSSNRRDLTVTQKVCIAYKDRLRTGDSLTVSAKKFGVSRTNLVDLRTIEDFCSNYVEILFQGGTIQMYEERIQRMTTTNKIGKLSGIIKANKEIREDLVTIRIGANDNVYLSRVETEAGKAEFWAVLNNVRMGYSLEEHVVEYLNLKYVPNVK